MRTSSGMILLSATLMCACASPPVHYYSLAPTTSSSATRQRARVALDILPVSLPAEIDRPEWITRYPGGSIEILGNKRWAAPLGEELQAALAAQLQEETRMPLPDSISAPDLPRLRLKLTLQRFDIAPGQPTEIVANWSLGVPGKPHLFCPLEFKAPTAQTDIAALANVRRWQNALAQQIGQALLAWSANSSTPQACSAFPLTDAH